MGERVELKEHGEVTPWEIQGADALDATWTVLFDGWVIVEVRQSNTGEYFCSKVDKKIPEIVHRALPTKVSASIRRRQDAFTPD